MSECLMRLLYPIEILLHSSQQIDKAINKTIITVSTFDKTSIIDGIETDCTNVTQCGANTINLKDESWW